MQKRTPGGSPLEDVQVADAPAQIKTVAAVSRPTLALLKRRRKSSWRDVAAKLSNRMALRRFLKPGVIFGSPIPSGSSSPSSKMKSVLQLQGVGYAGYAG